MQALRGHALAWRLERHDGCTERDSQERSKRATERMADNPYIRVGVHHGDVVVQILISQAIRVSGDDRSHAGQEGVRTTPVG